MPQNPRVVPFVRHATAGRVRNTHQVPHTLLSLNAGRSGLSLENDPCVLIESELEFFDSA